MGIPDSWGHALLNNRQLHFAPEGQAQSSDACRWLITLGAPLAAFNGSYVDAVATGQDDGHLKNGIAQMWGFSNRQGFERVARHLIDVGQRGKHWALWQVACEARKAMADNTLLGKAVALFVPATVLMKGYKAIDWKRLQADTGLSGSEAKTKIMKMVFEDDWLDGLAGQIRFDPRAVRSFVAWDAVRLVNVARWAVQLGYIGHDEFVPCADGLSEQVRLHYRSWQEVSQAYVLAGLVWNYSEARMRSLVDSNALLLSDKRSPYHTVRWF